MPPQDDYAFGGDEYDGVDCPARAAGFETKDRETHTGTAFHVAEIYDEMVRERVREQTHVLLAGSPEAGGIVTDGLAREEWAHALQRASEHAEHDQFWQTAVEEGAEVQEALGWD